MMKPNVTIVTPVRNRARAIAPFRTRYEAIQDAYGAARLRLIVVEGDSVDSTRAQALDAFKDDPAASVVVCNTGLPSFGSVVDPIRFRGLATVFNFGLDHVDLGWSDYAMLLPVDVAFAPAGDFTRLVERADERRLEVVSPLVFQGGQFYDVWAFQKDGQPFWHFLQGMARSLYGSDHVLMDTVGGAMLISRRVVAAGIRYSMTEVDRGLCRDVHAFGSGWGVWMDPSVFVEHLG